MSKQKITSFEELKEALNKLLNKKLESYEPSIKYRLHIELWDNWELKIDIPDYVNNSGKVCYKKILKNGELGIDRYRNDNENKEYFYMIGNSHYGNNDGYESETIISSENSQKIYDVVYAIKQCEVEDE